MNRRVFVVGIFGSSAAVILGYWGCQRGETNKSETLLFPQFLSTIMDENTIQKIGLTYRDAHSNENSEQELKTLILSRVENISISRSETEDTIRKFLEKKIQHDFKNDHTVIVDGWILSKTEVRQCALFTLAS
jgi:hypothetical protein